MGKSDDALLKVQHNLQYTFRDPELLKLALTHPSYAHEHPAEGGEEHHNQRLEFLGDAVLDFLVAAWLYGRIRISLRGRSRACALHLSVPRRWLHWLAELNLGAALRLGRGEEESGGRDRAANLCDALEAMAGALYLDGGKDVMWSRLEPWFSGKATAILDAEAYVDAKSRFQEWAQAELGQTPGYQIVDEAGPGPCEDFHGAGAYWGRGRGSRNGGKQAHGRTGSRSGGIGDIYRPRDRRAEGRVAR